MRLTYSGAQLLAMLASQIAALGTLAGAKILLVTNVEPLQPTTPVEDLLRADYIGYADSSAVVWNTPHLDPFGRAVVQCMPKEFKPTGAGPAVAVTNVVLVNAAGDTIIGSYALDSPLIFSNAQSVQLIGFAAVLDQPESDIENIVP